jgi:hypothetical protein
MHRRVHLTLELQEIPDREIFGFEDAEKDVGPDQLQSPAYTSHETAPQKKWPTPTPCQRVSAGNACVGKGSGR